MTTPLTTVAEPGRRDGREPPAAQAPQAAPAVQAPPAGPVAEPPVLREMSALVRPAIDRAVAWLDPAVRAPVDHHLAGRGKGVRASLALLGALACGGTVEDAMPGAVAVELVHNFSLVHDDVIDDDVERRHRPTVWSVFGVGPAIIAGDALSTLAVQVLVEHPGPGRPAAVAALGRATQAMIAGQALDMAYEARPAVSLEECLAMVRGKTAAMLACATELGAILAGAPDPAVRALHDFGMHLGTAFQAVDDVLGIWGDPAATGKPVGSDLVQRKKSIPVAAVLDRCDPATAGDIARRLAGPLDDGEVAALSAELEDRGGRAAAMALAVTHLAAAVHALGQVPLHPGPSAALADVARFVVARDR